MVPCFISPWVLNPFLFFCSTSAFFFLSFFFLSFFSFYPFSGEAAWSEEREREHGRVEDEIIRGVIIFHVTMIHSRGRGRTERYQDT